MIIWNTSLFSSNLLWFFPYMNFGEQWEHSPLANVALIHFWPGPLCRQSLFLVLAFLWGVFSMLFSFPSSTKTNSPNANSTRKENMHGNQLMWFLSKYCTYLSQVCLKVSSVLKRSCHLTDKRVKTSLVK